MTSAATTLTVASWNINGIRARLPHVVRYLKERAPDVLCLQETKIAYAEFPRAALEALGYRSAVLSSGAYAGVAILSRVPLERVTDGLDGFEPKRPAARRLAGRIGRVWIDTVYVPTRLAIGKIAFLDALRDDHARRYGDHAHVVLCGDFNICFDERDIAKPTMIAQSDLHPRRPEDLVFRRLVDERGLVDAFRDRCPAPGHYSWFSPTSSAARHNLGMRLDYVFASGRLAQRLLACEHDHAPREWDSPSDHIPVRATFELPVRPT